MNQPLVPLLEHRLGPPHWAGTEILCLSLCHNQQSTLHGLNPLLKPLIEQHLKELDQLTNQEAGIDQILILLTGLDQILLLLTQLKSRKVLMLLPQLKSREILMLLPQLKSREILILLTGLDQILLLLSQLKSREILMLLTQLKSGEILMLLAQLKSREVLMLLTELKSREVLMLLTELKSGEILVLLTQRKSGEILVLLTQLKSGEILVLLTQRKSREILVLLTQLKSGEILVLLAQLKSGEILMLLTELKSREVLMQLTELKSGEILMLLTQLKSGARHSQGGIPLGNPTTKEIGQRNLPFGTWGVAGFVKPQIWKEPVTADMLKVWWTLQVHSIHDRDVLAIVKKVCVTCPCCEARLRSLPAKLEEVEKKLDEFVARVEEKFSDLKDSLLPAQRVCSPDVDKAVKDAVSAINNRDHVILYGLPETGSTIKDFETVKDIFDSLGVNDVKAVDVFRLGKVQSDVGVTQSKPRLLKVRLSSSIVHNSLLKKAKLLRDSSKYKSVFIRRSYSFVERSRIKELYNVLRQKKDETGREFFIDRRGNVASWTVKERTTGSSVTSGIGSAQPASNC
eukprot:Em0001g61a